MKVLNSFFCIISLMTSIVVTSKAQKLPQVQQTSIFLNNLKVDGFSTEVGGQYQAYNKSIESFYAIANNSDYLYLTIHAAKSRVIEKILEGGVSFTIHPKKQNQAVVLFPLLSLPDGWRILHDAGKTLSEARTDIPSIIPGKDSILKAKNNLSIANANKRLMASLKEIKISGIKSIKDTIAGITDTTQYYKNLPLRRHNFKWITTNNNDGIKTAIQFDDKGEITYELALPIKYLQLGETDKFKYNITINGRGEDGRPGNTIVYSPQGMINQDLEYPTDFDGEYKLVK